MHLWRIIEIMHLALVPCLILVPCLLAGDSRDLASAVKNQLRESQEGGLRDRPESSLQLTWLQAFALDDNRELVVLVFDDSLILKKIPVVRPAVVAIANSDGKLLRYAFFDKARVDKVIVHVKSSLPEIEIRFQGNFGATRVIPISDSKWSGWINSRSKGP